MQGKIGLVTGAASGIGYELTKLLLQDAYNLVLIDIDAEKLKEIQKANKALYNCEILILVKDLSKVDVAEEIYEEVQDLGIEIDVLINNAGYGLFGMFSETSWQKEADMIHLHVLTTTHLTKLLLPGMLERKKGRILNVASLAAFQPGPLMSIYYATKAYLVSFSVAISNEVKGSGVSVSVLCPGLTKTGFQAVVSEESAKISWNMSSATDVAAYAYKAMNRGKVMIIPGFINRVLAKLPRFFSVKLAAKIVRLLQEKNRKSDLKNVQIDNSKELRTEKFSEKEAY